MNHYVTPAIRRGWGNQSETAPEGLMPNHSESVPEEALIPNGELALGAVTPNHNESVL